MPDIYTLVAKIKALPKRRIAEVEDFVDFLTLRRSSRIAKPPHREDRREDSPSPAQDAADFVADLAPPTRLLTG